MSRSFTGSPNKCHVSIIQENSEKHVIYVKSDYETK